MEVNDPNGVEDRFEKNTFLQNSTVLLKIHVTLKR